ncbi:MAG: thiamine kinase [Gammaproteobacteria bacterium]|jgi:thiamine kinase
MQADPLHNWSDWNTPFSKQAKLIRKIAGGHTNQNYLIKADKQLCVLRINSKNSTALGIDRQRELMILEQASAEDIAPKILYSSLEYGVLITEFIEGEIWQASLLQSPEKLSLLLETFDRIHRLKVSTASFDYQQHEENYWQQLLNRKITITDDLHRQRERILPLLTGVPSSNIICHQDPNPTNIIVQEDRVYFLDWEYAAPAWAAFDYAALSVEWGIPIEKLPISNKMTIEEINRAKYLYRHLCDLWLLIQNIDH